MTGQLLPLVQQGLRDTPADAWEATACVAQEHRVLLAASQLLGLTSCVTSWCRVRCWCAGRLGVAEELTTPTVAGLAALARRAAAAARQASAPPDLTARELLASLPSPPASPVPSPAAPPAGDGTSDALDAWCAETGRVLLARLASDALEAFGRASAATYQAATVNSRGLVREHHGTWAEAVLHAQTRGRSGTSWRLARHRDAIDAAALAEDAAARALAGPRWRTLAPGRLPALLEPAAVAALVLGLDELGLPTGGLTGCGPRPPEDAPGPAADERGRTPPLPGEPRPRRLPGEPPPPVLLRPTGQLPAGPATAESLLRQAGRGLWITRLGRPNLLPPGPGPSPRLHVTTCGGTFLFERGRIGPRVPELNLLLDLDVLTDGVLGATAERRAVAPAGEGAVVVPSLLLGQVEAGP